MSPTSQPLTIALTANSMQNLAHFRAPLIATLHAAGHRLIAIAPDDGTHVPGVDRQIDLPIDRGGTNPFKDWRTIRAYARCYRDATPGVAFSFTPKANIYGAIAAHSLNIPFIPTVSGLGTAFLKGGLIRSVQAMLYRRAFSRCPLVVFQNTDDRDLFVESRLVRSDQARIVPGSGIDLAQYTPVPLPNGSVVQFLFIGRLLGDKGVRELAAAARTLRDGGLRFGLTLVGDIDPGNPSAVSEREVRGWEEDGLLRWAGRQSDVRPFIAAADAVILPSYREGLPRALLEAAAMGRPMVASDVPGCRELAIKGETGVLCAPRDVASLADAMNRMAEMTSEERAVTGHRARDMVERRFDAKMVGQRYLDLLATLDL